MHAGAAAWENVVEVERWMGSGPSAGYQPQPNCECHDGCQASETAGAKLRRRKGNSPDHPLRSPTCCSVSKGVRAQSVTEQDYAMIQSIFLIITLAVLGANLLADMLYAFLDPRVRVERSA